MTLGVGHTRYARAYVQAGSASQRLSGRSRPMPASGGDFDLVPEAAAWVFEVNVNSGDDVALHVELCQDRGDVAPPPPVMLAGTIRDPWSPGTQTFGSAPGFEVRLTRTVVHPVDPAFVARAGIASGVSGTLTIPQGFAVEIVDIAGLYRPDPAAVPPAQGSAHVVGYSSADNQGRVFVNRRPDGTWARDTQFIEAQVRITALGGLVIPAGATIRWTIDDIDDPTNDVSSFHRDWGRYIDPNDYDASGDPIGAHPGDNTAAFSPGNADDNRLFGAAASGTATARWASATGGPATTASSRTQAETAISGTGSAVGTSAVRIHCMNVLGTNFVVRAELTGTPAGIPVHHTATGVMTMWSRLDVEVVRMAGAHSLTGALPSIPRFFLPACVQLDLQAERVVTGGLDKAEMAASDSLVSASSSAWVNDPGVFQHRGQGGWFFLGAARLPNPLPPLGTPPAPLFNGTTYTLGVASGEVFVEVAGHLPGADFVRFEWTDAASRTLRAGFSVRRSAILGSNTRIFLFGNDVTNGFTGHDSNGSIDHAMSTKRLYFPQHQTDPGSSTLKAGGYGIPHAGAQVRVSPAGAVFTAGISPGVPDATTGTGRFFAGRTIIFTQTSSFSAPNPSGSGLPIPRANFNAEVLSTVVHEFVHAFGMPHKCGHWDWRTPRQHSCCMNYFNTWLLDGVNNAIPGSVNQQGNDMCGRHLMEVRRVHLERNRGLNW